MKVTNKPENKSMAKLIAAAALVVSCGMTAGCAGYSTHNPQSNVVSGATYYTTNGQVVSSDGTIHNQAGIYDANGRYSPVKNATVDQKNYNLNQTERTIDNTVDVMDAFNDGLREIDNTTRIVTRGVTNFGRLLDVFKDLGK